MSDTEAIDGTIVTVLGDKEAIDIIIVTTASDTDAIDVTEVTAYKVTQKPSTLLQLQQLVYTVYVRTNELNKGILVFLP